LEHKTAEREPTVRRIEAKPNLELCIPKQNADMQATLPAIRILGMINGPGAVPGPGMIPNHPFPPRDLMLDNRFVAQMEEKLRNTTDPELKKEITRILEKMK